MGKYTIEITSKARKELLIHYKSGNKSLIRNIEQIFLELSNTPFEGTGNPEALKYNLTGYWSRRIDKKNRIIYKVYEDKVVHVTISIGVFSLTEEETASSEVIIRRADAAMYRAKRSGKNRVCLDAAG